MIEFDSSDTSVQVDEIEDLIDKHDKEGVFSSKERFKKNFYLHFIKLIEAGHIMTFRDVTNGKLIGYCAWIIVDKKRKQEVNKVRWVLPDNIEDGHILYITSCLSTNPRMIPKIRKCFTERFKDTIKDVIWFNVERSRYFHYKNKGGVLCTVTADF